MACGGHLYSGLKEPASVASLGLLAMFSPGKDFASGPRFRSPLPAEGSLLSSEGSCGERKRLAFATGIWVLGRWRPGWSFSERAALARVMTFEFLTEG